jgi:hypothetical protein
MADMDKLDCIEFAIAVLEERKHTLTNPYAPLYEKITKTQRELDKIKIERNEAKK